MFLDKYLLIILIITIISTKSSYDLLVEWGKNNSFTISNKLEMRYISENNKTFYAKETIKEKEELLRIPYELILNVDNSLILYKMKKLSTLYEKYKRETFIYDVDFIPGSIDQSFIAYLIYYINNRVKKYKKNYFYQHFRYFLDTFETNLDSIPLFYTEKQSNLLKGSLAAFEISQMNLLYKEETEKFQKLTGKEVPLEEYIKYRTLVTMKSYNISNHAGVVPFLDMFIPEPKNFDLAISLEKDRSIKIYAVKNIPEGKEISIKCPMISNNKMFLLYGRTFENMINYVDTFDIPIISLKLLQNKKVNSEDFNFDFTINLVEDKFYEDALDAYKDFSKKAKEDGSDLSAYKFLLQNLEYNREDYNHVTTSHIYQEFYQKRDIDNVKRVLNFEKDFLDDKINVVKKVIDTLEKAGKKNNDEL